MKATLAMNDGSSWSIFPGWSGVIAWDVGFAVCESYELNRAGVIIRDYSKQERGLEKC